MQANRQSVPEKEHVSSLGSRSEPQHDIVKEQPKKQQMIVPVIGGSRNPAGVPLLESGQRQWTYGLFSCFEDIGKTAFAWCFPCGLYANSKSKVTSLEATQFPATNGGDVVNGDCCMFCLSAYCGCPCFFVYMQRQDLERRYQIKDEATDFFISWCCLCCALVQQAREIEAEEKSFAVELGPMSGGGKASGRSE